MRETIRFARRVYYRSLLFQVPFLALGIACSTILWQMHKGKFTSIDFLNGSLLWGYLGAIYLLFAGYELLSMIRRNGGVEVVEAIPGGYLKLYFGKLKVLLGPVAIWSALIFLWQVYDYFQMTEMYPPYLTHALLSVFLYCTMPGIIAILWGGLLSKYDRPFAYVCILISVFLCSPVCKTLFHSSIFDWFALCVPDAEWFADAVYGIPMEHARWVIRMFWILVLLFLTFMNSVKRHTALLKGLELFLFVVAIGCALCFIGRKDDYLMIKNTSANSIVMSEQNYYQNSVVEAGETDEKSAFEIKMYELTLTAKDSLEASASIRLAESRQGTYKFTLYHGYEVKSVTNESGNNLSFTREGDYLDIEADDPIETICICYKGNGNKYFANYQALNLPGYFPYYPWPGHYEIWNHEKEAFRVRTTFPELHYKVTLQTSCPVFTNIRQISENVYEDDCQAISIFGGIMKQEVRNGVRYSFSPVGWPLRELKLQDVKNKWNEICKMTGEERQIDIDDKSIFILPDIVASANVSDAESAVIMDDHILLYALSTPEAICAVFMGTLLPDDAASGIVRSLFLSYLDIDEDYNDAVKPSYEKLEILKEYNSSGEITDLGDWEQYSDAECIYLYDLMDYLVARYGKEEVLHCMYEYLNSEEPRENQIDFLYMIGE